MLKKYLSVKYSAIWAPLGGALVTFSFAPFHLWPLGLLGLLIFTWLSNQSHKRPFLVGWLFGLGYFISGAYWVYISIHEHGGVPAPLAVLLMFVFTGVLSIFPALTLWLYRKLLFSGVAGALVLPLIWMFFEWVRSWLWTGFPWLLVGYAQIDSPLAGWLPIIGAWSTGYLVVLSATLVFFAVISTSKRDRFLPLLTVGFIFVSGVLLDAIDWVEDTGERRSVGLVQPNIPQALKWKRDQYDLIIDTMQVLTPPDVDLVVWPEASIPRSYPYSKNTLNELKKEAIRNKQDLIVGLPYIESEEKYYNSLMVLGLKEQTYFKNKLVPFGESIPLKPVLQPLIKHFDVPVANFSAGNGDAQQLYAADMKIAPMICYEIAFGNFTAQQARNSDLLLTVSNDSWFGDSIGPLQHFQMARVRAKEHGRYLVRATNNGVTAIVNDNGDTVVSMPQFKAGNVVGEVSLMRGSTPYNRVGDNPTVVMMLILLGCTIAARLRKSPKIR